MFKTESTHEISLLVTLNGMTRLKISEHKNAISSQHVYTRDVLSCHIYELLWYFVTYFFINPSTKPWISLYMQDYIA